MRNVVMKTALRILVNIDTPFGYPSSLFFALSCDGKPINERLDESGGHPVGHYYLTLRASKNGLKGLRPARARRRIHLGAGDGNLPTCPYRGQHRARRPARAAPARDARRTAP